MKERERDNDTAAVLVFQEHLSGSCEHRARGVELGFEVNHTEYLCLQRRHEITYSSRVHASMNNTLIMKMKQAKVRGTRGDLSGK